MTCLTHRRLVVCRGIIEPMLAPVPCGQPHPRSGRARLPCYTRIEQRWYYTLQSEDEYNTSFKTYR